MGKFGHHLCENLLKLGNDVMAVDISEDKVADMIYKVTNIQIGDCTNPQVVRSFGVGNFDIVFVCIGSNFQNSLEVTSLVKEMGAKHVISKANRDVHAKFLLRTLYALLPPFNISHRGHMIDSSILLLYIRHYLVNSSLISSIAFTSFSSISALISPLVRIASGISGYFVSTYSKSSFSNSRI